MSLARSKAHTRLCAFRPARWRRAGALGALGALLALLAPATALAGPGLEVGVQDDAALLHGWTWSQPSALAAAARMHATRVRVTLGWATVLSARQAHARHEPARPAYRFGDYDRLVDAAAARGMRVQMTLTGRAPAYATADHRVGWDAPKARAFGRFAHAVAAHFAGRVNRYSIWNEPNFRRWLWPQRRAATLYRGLYAAGYAAIKRADRHAAVLLGETGAYRTGLMLAPLAFLRDVLCVDRNWRPRYRHGHRTCKPLRADGFAHHPYEFGHPPAYRRRGADNVTIGTLGRLTHALHLLAAHHVLSTPPGRALPVYLTEFGYFASGKQRRSPRRRAAWLTQAYRMALAAPGVRELVAYGLVAPGRKSPWRLWDTALLDRRGRPRAAYTALAHWSAGQARSRRIERATRALALPRAR
jgi:hypothetical protein